MARKAAKGKAVTSKTTSDSVTGAPGLESGVVKLAEQLGWFVGTVQAKADGWLDSEALKQQMTQIRDGAAQMLEQVNRAGAAAGESATKLAKAAKAAMPDMPAMPSLPAMPGTASKKAAAAKRAAQDQKRQQSRQAVAAPGKKHRKPPPQEKVERRASAPATKQLGRKNMAGASRRGRG